MKDRDQKRKALQYCVSKRWLPQLEVDVHPPQSLARKSLLMTDLDVLASMPDDFLGFRQVVIDCKTLSRESAVNRSLWLRGVLDRMNADHGICILKKSSIEADHKLVATGLDIVLLAEDEFDVFAEATSTQYRSKLGHSANIEAWECFFGIKDQYPKMALAMQFVRSLYWMQGGPGEACRKAVAFLYDIRTELDPAKPEHMAMVVEFAVLFGRSLAMLASFLFRAYLHPKNQHELEEAVKVLLYGGRDAYEHRNQLYRLLKEKSGADTGSGDLALPEWTQFIQLTRQLMDAPVDAARAPLILREFSFAHLLGSADFEFAKTLCKESPQAGRFSVLILSYLLRSARLPADFSARLEPTLLGLLEK